jgi:DNA-binding winged helix-turn-helix (wHTH) protein
MSRKNLNYVSRACDFCKGRHKKCDGGKPCVPCLQRNWPCVYSQKVNKRGPKPKRNLKAKIITQSTSKLRSSLNGSSNGLQMIGSIDSSGYQMSSPGIYNSSGSSDTLQMSAPIKATYNSNGSSTTLQMSAPINSTYNSTGPSATLQKLSPINSTYNSTGPSSTLQKSSPINSTYNTTGSSATLQKSSPINSTYNSNIPPTVFQVPTPIIPLPLSSVQIQTTSTNQNDRAIDIIEMPSNNDSLDNKRYISNNSGYMTVTEQREEPQVLVEANNISPINNHEIADSIFDDTLTSDSEWVISQKLSSRITPLSPHNRYFCDVTLSAFIQTLPWYPVVISIDALDAGVYMNIANCSIEDKVKVETLSRAFLYNTIFAHGSRLIGNEEASAVFINKAFYIMNYLFLRQGIVITKPELAEILLQGFVFFIPFVIGNHIERARAAIVHAFTLWNTFSDELSISLIYRVYIHMLEISSDIVDRQYWLQTATKLGQKAMTIENRSLMSYMLVFSPKAELIYSLNSDPQLCTHISYIVHFLETCDNWIINSLSDKSQEQEDISNVYAYRSIISSCKCYMYQRLDKMQSAISSAFEAISFAVNTTFPYLPVIIVLAHVIRFLLEGAKDKAMGSSLFFQGIRKIRENIAYVLNIPYLSQENNLPPNEFTKSDLQYIKILCSTNSPLSLSIAFTTPTDIPYAPMDPLFCDNNNILEDISNEGSSSIVDTYDDL